MGLHGAGCAPALTALVGLHADALCELKLGACGELTHEALHALGCCTRLRSLRIDRARIASVAGLASLVSGLPRLERLDLVLLSTMVPLHGAVGGVHGKPLGGGGGVQISEGPRSCSSSSSKDSSMEGGIGGGVAPPLRALRAVGCSPDALAYVVQVE